MALNFPDSPTLNQVYTDTTSGFSYQWDGVVWQSYAAASSSQIKILDNISGSFNGSTQTFTLKLSAVNYSPANAQQLRVVLGGIVQEPGVDYTVSSSSITFTTAPTAELDCSIVSLGPAIPINTVEDGTVTPAKLSTGGPSWNTGGDLNVSGIVTAGTFVGQINAGVGTITTLTSTNAGLTNINSSGISTLTTLNSTNATLTNVNSTGISTLTTAGVTNLTTQQLNVTGLSTHIGVATFQSGLFGASGSFTGIVTATSFSGDGSALTGVSFSIGAGSTAAPSLSPTGDSNTGIFFPAADTIAFGEGGAEAARIDSSSRLLVGTSSAVSGGEGQYAKLQVVGNTSSATGAGYFALVGGRAGDSFSSGNRIGRVVFTGTDNSEFANIECFADAATGSGDYPGRLVFSTTADGASSPTTRMTIKNTGVIEIAAINTVNPVIQVSSGPINTGTQSIAIGQAMASATGSDNCIAIGGVSCAPSLTTGDQNTFIGAYTGSVITTGQQCAHFGYNLSASSSGVSNEYLFGAGLTGKGSGTAFIAGAAYQGNNSSTWSTTSDQRLKKNITTNVEGLEKINQIRVVNFEYRLQSEIEQEDLRGQSLIKEDENGQITGIQGTQLGVIAQEIQQICPDCVKEESTGVLSVVTDNVFWHMVNAIKELSEQNAALEARLSILEGNA